LTQEKGLELIRVFIDGADGNSIGFEPYPASLRGINWIKFLSEHNRNDTVISTFLYGQYQQLLDNLEHHLLGNHLLDNGFSLLFGAYFFHDKKLYDSARNILTEELAEQILADGGHFERSPMYHQLILHRLLDCVNLVRNNDVFGDELKGLLYRYDSSMTSWLKQITFENGDIPLVNDAANGIAPTTAALCDYAHRLDIPEKNSRLADSGYRKNKRGNYEILVDVGAIGPDYNPGHAHSDTFNFILYADGKPFIVDTGTSTYESGERRLRERQTAAHNTVRVGGYEQSEVWNSFRVARRAYVKDLREDEYSIAASHTGYERIGATHQREFIFSDRDIQIIDQVESRKEYACHAFLHFHPNVDVRMNESRIIADERMIVISGADRIELKDYDYAPEFNRLIPAKVAEIRFTGQLETKIHL
jgi:uncharacterized heparinase superfamily protein